MEQIAVWICLYWSGSANSARILGLFTLDARSHFNFHETMMKTLLEAGHQVTVVAPFSSHYYHPNFTIINSRIEKRRVVHPVSTSAVRDDIHWLKLTLNLHPMFREDCEHIMSLQEIKIIKNFDIMFVEAIRMYQCYLPIAKMLQIPVIITSSCRSLPDSDYAVGNSRNPSVFPIEAAYVHPKMTFYERLLNFLNELLNKQTNIMEQFIINKFYKEYFPNIAQPAVSVSLLFINNFQILLPRIKAPNVINIGGIYVKSDSLNPLPKDLKTFIEGAEHGVVLLSLGSLITSDALRPNIMSAMKSTFAKLNQRVIWKFDGHIEGLSQNVLLRKWLPQKEILAHKNVVAFISHCGLSSTYESIYYGKPMILIPICADQLSNAGILHNLKVGLYLDAKKFTEEELSDAINEIINNTKYSKNMEKLSKIFKDEFIPAKELIVYWTEYVLRHKGATHLRSMEVDLSLHQYLLLDVIAFLLISVTSMGILINLLRKFSF